MNATFIYQAANLIAIGVNDPRRFPNTLRKAFPGLFNAPTVEDWQSHKAAFKKAADRHNQFMQMKGGPENG